MNRDLSSLAKTWPGLLPGSRRQWFWTGLLLAGTALCFLLLGARVLIAGRTWLLYLIWNLFLGWIPVWLAAACWLMHRQEQRWSWRMIMLAGGWLLFFPNAAYLATDLIHLKHVPPLPLWYDAVLLACFAVTGVLLGNASLAVMHDLVARRFNARAGWWFAGAACVLGSFGVYLGRFERWNSRDLLVKPLALFDGIAAACAQLLANPEALEFTVLFGTFMFGAYALCRRWLERSFFRD